MFYPDPLVGSSLPDKTLCLTFDDGPGETYGEGPGPKTLRLAKYLKEENIPAAFFMVGNFIVKNPYVMSKVAALGHLVGNHTYNHHHIDLLHPEVMIAELESTDELIKNYIPGKTVYFRAPYGSWDQKLADILNNGLNNNLQHIGPYGWDIDCHDWSCWKDGISPQACADRYLTEILKIGKGIVLMHDSTADLERIRVLNRTCEMVKILIPKLKSLGYHFIRLDEIKAH